MSDEWSEWIEHDGEHVPNNVRGSWCMIEGHDGAWGNIVVSEGRVERGHAFVCKSRIFGPQVIRYRIRKPRGLTILQQLIEHLPEREHA